MNKEKIRAPVLNTFRKKSPFEQLLKHMGKVNECVDILGDGLLDITREITKVFQKSLIMFQSLSMKPI